MAAAVAAGVTAVQTSGGTDEAGRPRSVLPGIPAGPVANAEQALDRAAAAADARTFTPPRPDQWIYTELRIRTSAKPAGGVTGGPYKTYIRRHWERGDGKKSAEIVNGQVKVLDEFSKTIPPKTIRRWRRFLPTRTRCSGGSTRKTVRSRARRGRTSRPSGRWA